MSTPLSHSYVSCPNFCTSLSILNDAQFGLVNINSTRFPNASAFQPLNCSYSVRLRVTFSDGVKVHDGFQKTFERTADGVLSGVKDGLSSTGATKVLVTGHSLGMSLLMVYCMCPRSQSCTSGAAISTMDALMLKANLPSSIQIITTVFGLPRGGNQAFADMIDSIVG